MEIIEVHVMSLGSPDLFMNTTTCEYKSFEVNMTINTVVVICCSYSMYCPKPTPNIFINKTPRVQRKARAIRSSSYLTIATYIAIYT